MLFVVLTYTLIISCGQQQQTSRAEEGDSTLEHMKSVLEQLIQKEIDRGLASASVAIVKGDQIVWTGAYGYANVGMKALATTETI